MSNDPTPFQAWRGMVLSFRDDTDVERAFVDGILHLMAVLTDPEYDGGMPTAEQVEAIARRIDEKRTAGKPAYVDGHGGPHIVKYNLSVDRPYFYFIGPPVGRTVLSISVEYDDPLCADRAALSLADALELGAWKGET